ncbi:hypothetical protein ACT6P2_06325 [Enterococcus lactis]|uniref:hypothetical protein n=1 Tax=Enterococcus lactis TaxID=357441 RepID=UPI0040411B1E
MKSKTRYWMISVLLLLLFSLSMPVVNVATQAGETHAVIEINEREIGKQTEKGEEKQKSSFPEANEAKAGLISFVGTLLIIGVILVYRHQIRGGEKHEN